MKFTKVMCSLAVASLLAGGCSKDPVPTMVGIPFSSYAHEDEPFAQELFNEHASVPQVEDAELLFVAADYDAKYTHVRRLARRTLTTSEAGPTIWFFGGSTVFGIGQRDEHTIPSEIVRLAKHAGTPVNAVNFGFPSYASWQEVGLMKRALADRPAPDLIVFYHGINDFGVICRQLALGIEPDGLGNPLAQEQPKKPKTVCTSEPQAVGALIASAVSRSMADAASWAGPIPIVSYWQPFAGTRAPKETDGPLRKALKVNATGLQSQGKPYRAALALVKPRPVDLTDVFDSYDGPLFFDWAHTNELGAHLVAKAMWDRSLRREVAALR